MQTILREHIGYVLSVLSLLRIGSLGGDARNFQLQKRQFNTFLKILAASDHAAYVKFSASVRRTGLND